MSKVISSLQNRVIRNLVQLQEKSRLRKLENLFVIEGRREIRLAIEGGFEIRKVFYCPDLISDQEVSSFSAAHLPEIIVITKDVYSRLAYRGSTEGVLAVAKSRPLQLSEISFKNPTPLILVAEAPEKPGNIGALLRTADAAGLDAVLIANPRTDMYNPNIIRSSVGCLFTVQVGLGTTAEIIRFLQDQSIGIFGAALQAPVPYHTADYTTSTAIVVGTEASGLSEEWLEKTTQNIVIPMHGKIDSMNVSVAAGILIFEAIRQREKI